MSNSKRRLILLIAVIATLSLFAVSALASNADIVSVGFTLIKSTGSAITDSISIGFSLVKSTLSSVSSTLSVGFALIKSVISSTADVISVGFALIKEAIINAFATIVASFRLSATPSAVFDYFEQCSHVDCEYKTIEYIKIGINRIKNTGDSSIKINMKLEELNADGTVKSGGFSLYDWAEDVNPSTCVAFEYDEETGSGSVSYGSCNMLGYIKLIPRPAGTYYFGMKIWADGESEPSYPVPGSPNQPANAKAWSVSIPANFVVSASSNCPVYINQTAEFSANVSGNCVPPYTYNWDFGDGESATGKNVTHIFPSYWRSWNVKVTVTDSDGHVAEDTVVCCVVRAKTDEHVDTIDDTPYYALLNALVGQTFEGPINESAEPNFIEFGKSVTIPYTNILGSLFFVIFFGAFFIMMWLRQGNIAIPSTIGIIVGGVLLKYAPAEFRLPAILFISFNIFGIIYTLLKERS